MSPYDRFRPEPSGSILLLFLALTLTGCTAQIWGRTGKVREGADKHVVGVLSEDDGSSLVIYELADSTGYLAFRIPPDWEAAPMVQVDQDVTELQLVISIPLETLPGYGENDARPLQPIEIHYALSDLKEVDLKKGDEQTTADHVSAPPYRLVSGTTTGVDRTTYHRLYGFSSDSRTWVQLGEVDLERGKETGLPTWQAFLLTPFTFTYDVVYGALYLTVVPAGMIVMAFPYLLHAVPR